jgi:hypothetical protein
MVPMAAHELLTRASMDLRGTRPAPAELDQIEIDGSSYEALVDAYLRSPEFLERVKDTYDDAILVRREDFSDEARDETWAIYGEALELIAYIVRNDRPFTELGTADYTVASQLFQRDPDRMPFPMEPVSGSAWQPTHYTDGRPHAGLLSTSAFYQVWDTNNTNKNRRRANRISIVYHCYNFLETPVDVTRDVDNNDPNAVLNAVTGPTARPATTASTRSRRSSSPSTTRRRSRASATATASSRPSAPTAGAPPTAARRRCTASPAPTCATWAASWSSTRSSRSARRGAPSRCSSSATRRPARSSPPPPIWRTAGGPRTVGTSGRWSSAG